MKTASAPLIALLATRLFNYASLFEFTLVGGGSLYYCSGDTDISYGGHTYTAGGTIGPYFDTTDNKAKAHWKTGVEVDTLTFDIMPGAATVQGEAFLKAVRDGVFDGAEVVYSGAYWPQQTWASPIVPTGVVVKQVGRMAEMSAGRSLIPATVNSHLELLNQNMPRNIYQSGCVNTLYDASCALIKSSFAVAGTALTGSTPSVISATIANATGYFDLGSIAFSSGPNAGVARSIKAYVHGAPGTVSLISPFPTAPAAGDAFTIYPGCDKTQGTCGSKFGNAINYRGFRFIPENSTGV